MIGDLKRIFGNDISHCIVETNQAQVELFDCYNCDPATQRSYIKTKENQPIHFTLHNPSSAQLTFAAVDNCLLGSAGAGRCDFLIGNHQKIYFVEIKQVSTKQRSAARDAAVKQLYATIELVKPGFPDAHKIAVICIGFKKAHPLQSATKAAEIVRFRELHNADLMEGTVHTF